VVAGTKQVLEDLYKAYEKWQQDDGSHMAASVSFYMAVSFFPLLLVLMSATGLVLRFTGWGQSARQRLIDLISHQTAPILAHQVEAVLRNVQNRAAIGGPIGLLTLFFASMAVFVHLDDAMDRIWNVRRSNRPSILGAIRSVLVDRMRAFLMLLGVSAFATAGFVASMTVSAIEEYASGWIPMPTWVWSLTTLAAAVALNWLLFAIVYKVLPKVNVKWRDAVRGALFAAVMWEAGRRLLAALVIGSKYSVYGVVGTFVAIMLWVFYAVTILFLGAEYIQVSCARSESRRDSLAQGTAKMSDHA
jgi:membrane protein